MSPLMTNTENLPVLSGGPLRNRSSEVIESYIFSTGQRDYTIYSERLLMRIVSLAQKQLAGIDFRKGVKNIGQVSIGPLGEALVEIPIKSLLSEGNTNYAQAKNAIVELMNATHYVERPMIRGGEPVLDRKGNIKYEFLGHQILNSCKVNVKPGYAIIEVNSETWRSILDFGKGFRKFSLDEALRLKRNSSLRLFQLLSNQATPLTYTIDDLRAMWNMQDRYPDPYDFIKRNIDPAKAELDEKTSWSFTYVKNYGEPEGEGSGKRGRRKVVSITFTPVHRYATAAPPVLLTGPSAPEAALGQELYESLLNKFSFSARGVANNLLLFSTAKEEGIDIGAFLNDIASNALRAANIPGYVINALSNHLQEHCGVTVREGKVSRDETWKRNEREAGENSGGPAIGRLDAPAPDSLDDNAGIPEL